MSGQLRATIALVAAILTFAPTLAMAQQAAGSVGVKDFAAEQNGTFKASGVYQLAKGYKIEEMKFYIKSTKAKTPIMVMIQNYANGEWGPIQGNGLQKGQEHEYWVEMTVVDANGQKTVIKSDISKFTLP